MPWFNRPFVARKTPVFHVISIAVDDKLPNNVVSLAILNSLVVVARTNFSLVDLIERCGVVG